MIKATIKHGASLLFVMLLMMSLTTKISAQYTFTSDNVIIDGDFADDTLSASWGTSIDSGTATFGVAEGEAAITGLGGQTNSWDVQLFQELTDDQIAELAKGGDWELTFDARTTADSTKTFHVFLGNNETGGDWARYWTDNYTFTTDTTITLKTNITQTWPLMKFGFEVAHDAQDIFLDNIMLTRVSETVLVNGDFEATPADSGWSSDVASSATITFDTGELAITDITALDPWSVQVYQPFTTANQEQLDSIYVGPYEILFDARTDAEEKTFNLFFGRNEDPYTNFGTSVTVTNEMTQYVIPVSVTEVWDNMKLGFEVSADASSIYFDNVILRRVREIAPDAPSFNLSTSDGVVTITVDAQGGVAEYEVFFADSAFTSSDGGASVGTIDASGGLTFEHSTVAPHPDLAADFTAHYGVVAKTESGTASELTVNSILTGMTSAENYMVEISDDALDVAFEAVDGTGIVPEASVLAGFFPDSYKPFEISESSGRKIIENGSGGDNDADISGKLWVGFHASEAYMILYAEITDDVLVPTPRGTSGGEGYNYDSWEIGIGAYSPESFINGSDHQSYQIGAEPDYQWRAGLRVDTAAYIVGTDQGAGAFNGDILGSVTIGDDSQSGMYRLLTLVNTNAFSAINTESVNFDFPTGSEVSTVPFNFTINDADAGTRDTQIGWSTKGGQDDWWNTPARWETVALVGADAVPVSNESEEQGKVSEFSLDQNYPNPFNPTTNISFRLATSSNVTLEVYNLLGQKVATLLQNQKLNAGSHTQHFDASRLSSGMYMYRISTESFTQSRKMMLIK